MAKSVRTLAALYAVLVAVGALAGEPKLPGDEPWRVKLLKDWRALPEPPIAFYGGPFGERGDFAAARGFVGNPDSETRAKVFLREYDPAQDPRPIDQEWEAAAIEEFRKVGFNTSYMVALYSGRLLKRLGMLGYIDQSRCCGNKPFIQYDGKPGWNGGGDGTGSYLVRANYDRGVDVLVNLVGKHGDLDMVKIGDVYLTSSWDEAGMRERNSPDYCDESLAEYIVFLRDVWFQDQSPAEDTNKDGRTYNGFTGEKLKEWAEVKPPALSARFYSQPQPVDEQWTRRGAYKLWMDFHRYYSFEFFRRISEDATARAGKRVDCYPFPQAFIMWPGMNVFMSYGMYWNHRQNAAINNEQCWPAHPAMAVNYAVSDHLARKHNNTVMGWSWFYPRAAGPGQIYDGPGYPIERALARLMGHTVDGIHHWVYDKEYRGPQEGPLRQRRQLAYWHNFFRLQYAAFLSKSEPVRPDVAILLPDYSGYFYPMFLFNKDFAWLTTAFGAAQLPFAIVTEEEIEREPDALKPFKAVYVASSEWSTPTLRQRFADYVAAGGTLCANGDSLSLDITTGARTDFLEKVCGVKLTHKHKTPFMPSIQSPEERDWAAKIALPQFQNNLVHEQESTLWKKDGDKWVRDEEAWAKLDASLATMPKAGRGGLPQSVLDMRKPPVLRYAEELGGGTAVSYGELCTAEAVRGKPVAWHGEQVCGVETERTVWLGDRAGASIHAIFPRMDLARGTEPVNPFTLRGSDDYEKFRPYVKALTRATDKAGVKRLVTLARDGVVPCNLEVLPRVAPDGTLMVVVVNHDGTDATYEVTVDPEHLKKPGLKDAQAWDLLREKKIEPATDGRFAFKVEPWRAAIFMVGAEKALAPAKAAQAKLQAMDLSVPAYFLAKQKKAEEKK